jgi:hypothetical protein
MEKHRTGESEIAEAVLRILAEAPNGEATIAHLKKRVPEFVKLTEGDQVQSDTRPNEELWEQLVRNIVSHHKAEGNIVAEGLANRPSRGKLRITEAGRIHVKNKYN